MCKQPAPVGTGASAFRVQEWPLPLTGRIARPDGGADRRADGGVRLPRRRIGTTAVVWRERLSEPRSFRSAVDRDGRLNGQDPALQGRHPRRLGRHHRATARGHGQHPVVRRFGDAAQPIRHQPVRSPRGSENLRGTVGAAASLPGARFEVGMLHAGIAGGVYAAPL